MMTRSWRGPSLAAWGAFASSVLLAIHYETEPINGVPEEFTARELAFPGAHIVVLILLMMALTVLLARFDQLKAARGLGLLFLSFLPLVGLRFGYMARPSVSLFVWSISSGLFVTTILLLPDAAIRAMFRGHERRLAVISS